MQPWTRRASRLARETVRSLGQAVRTQTTPHLDATPVVEQAVSPGDLPRDRFVNPIGEGADPTVVRDGERYLWCQAEGNVAISLWVSDRLTSIGAKHVVWRADDAGPCSQEVWAPELVRLDGRWHIYFAASDGRNRNHRTFVLVADTDDPLGAYTLHGPLFTGDEPGGPDLWSIDFTVLEHGGRRFGLWSGWPDLDTDLQHLYIAEMTSPTEIGTGRVRIAEAGAHLWERIEETPESRGLLEGPRVLRHDGRTFVVYSCAASWWPTYKLGLLELTGDDPLDPASWSRSDRPVFESSTSTYGVGHGDFVELDDGWWHLFHSKIDERDGWRRTLHVQAMTFSDDGTPSFGTPAPRGEVLTAPRSDVRPPRRRGGSWKFAQDGLEEFDYYGHHQYAELGPSGLELGIEPEAPVNAFRSAEKLLLRGGDFDDVEVAARFTFVEGDRAVGVLLRVTGPAVGYDAQRGYFAGVALDRKALVIGKTDGHTWTPLAEENLHLRSDPSLTIRVTAQGDELVVVGGGGRLSVRDAEYTRGSVGIRVVDTHARFSSFTVESLSPDSSD